MTNEAVVCCCFIAFTHITLTSVCGNVVMSASTMGGYDEATSQPAHSSMNSRADRAAARTLCMGTSRESDTEKIQRAYREHTAQKTAMKKNGTKKRE